MQPYSADAAKAFKLNASNDWLRHRQNLALPVLPPTSPEARKYFFTQSRELALVAAGEGKSRVNYEAMAKQWNSTADGKERFYVTSDLLQAYAKTWERATNVKASRELMTEQLENVQRSAGVFAASDLPFPAFLTGDAQTNEPSQGNFYDMEVIPSTSSLSTSLSTQTAAPIHHREPHRPTPSHLTHPEFEGPTLFMPSSEASTSFASTEDMNIDLPAHRSPTTSQSHEASTHDDAPSMMEDVSDLPEFNNNTTILDNTESTGRVDRKRRREVPKEQRQRNVRQCRRCKNTTCPGNSGVAKCSLPCVACQECGGMDDVCPSGTDKGRICKVKNVRIKYS